VAVAAGPGPASASTDAGPGPVDPASAHPAHRRRDRRRWAGALAWYLATAFALVTLNFLLPRAMPGNPIEGLVAQGPNGLVSGEQGLAKLQAYYHLDGSLASQYGHYLDRLAHGDLGRSIVSNQPVTHEIARRLGWTLLLIGGALVLSTLIGLVAGVHSGWRREGRVDRALMTALLALREFPPFLLASLLLFSVAIKLNWLPPFGSETPFSSSFGLVHRFTDIVRHALLPLLVLTVGLTVGSYLQMRAGMVNELGSDYLLLGRAKGLRERRLKYRYAARNALLPVVTITALQLGTVIGGDVLIERVFSYPGLGSLIFSSINDRDYPAIQGIFVITSLTIVTVNALTDVLYRRLDPRTTA
jgi:peptide/nickel transport system permease protein